MEAASSNINLLESLIQLSGTCAERILKAEVAFTQMCRTCLNKATENSLWKNIFYSTDTNGTSVTIKYMLEVLTGLKINVEDKLPYHICHGCLEAVEAAYAFFSYSRRNDEILKRFLKQIYTPKEGPCPENELVPCTEVVNAEKSGKIDEIQIEGYQVRYVNEGIESSSFQCNPCNMVFTTQIELDKHKAEHDPTDSKRKHFKCGICAREYSFRNGLHNHLMTAHVQKKEFQCPVCGKTFKKRDRFLQHQKSFCIAPDATKKTAKGASQITIYPIGKWMTASSMQVEIKDLSCSLCGGAFELEGEFLNHLQKHSAEKRCPYCKKFFSRALSLESHVRSHTNERPFVCPVCSKRFTASRTLRNHLKLHTRRKVYTCDVCEKNYVNENELLIHQNSHEENPISVDLEEHEEAISFSEKISLESNDCKEHTFKEEPNSPLGRTGDFPKTPLVDNVNNEWIKDTYDIKYKMEPGDISINSSTSSSTSIQSVCKTEPGTTSLDFNISKEAIVVKKERVDLPSDLDSKPVQPDIDPIGFEITFKEENLEETHSAFEITNEPLSDDETSFDQFKHDCTQSHWNRPSIGIENTGDQEKLDDSNPTFKVTNDPLLYLETFAQSKQESIAASYTSFTCALPECKMEFRYYRDIINHYTTQHCLGPPPFKCPVCTKVFPLKLDVRNHLKSHLTCEYKCPYCPRAYWQLRDLKIHLRTHTGERPFKCTKCPKRFKQRPALRVHIKTHNISKEYKCNMCSKEFFSYNGLFLHTKGHTEIKELQCKFCSKQFPTKSRLRRHQNGICPIRTSTKS